MGRREHAARAGASSVEAYAIRGILEHNARFCHPLSRIWGKVRTNFRIELFLSRLTTREMRNGATTTVRRHCANATGTVTVRQFGKPEVRIGDPRHPAK